MASEQVRDAIKAAVTAAAAPVPVYDLSDYHDMSDVLPLIDSQAVMLQYVSADEFIASIGGEDNQGWDEVGSCVLHIVVPTGFASDTTVQLGDTIRKQLRGKRLTPGITIDACPPFVDYGLGGGIEGAWHSWMSDMLYTSRTCGVG